MEYVIGTKVFGDWEIIREIGEGSYGKVFELKKEQFGITSKAALKLIRIPKTTAEIREALSDGMDEKSVTSYFKGIVEQFVKEIAVMSELKGHPNIVGCEDFVVNAQEGSIGWDILIRMELLTPMLEYELQHKWTEEQVKKLAMDMCEALIFCQKKGLIHRDIKPGNIFVDAVGNFRLGDFGVARTAEKTMGGMSKQGTENYMAPEVYYVRPYGANVDIYSLGIVLYRLMNGNRLPFWPLPPEPVGFTDKIEALSKRMKGAEIPEPLYASEAFAKIILKACEADSKKRYHTAGEMLADLKGLTVHSETPAEDNDIFTPPTFEEEKDSTLNLWGDRGDSGESTENPFGNVENDGDIKVSGDVTINPFGDVSFGGKTDDKDSTINPFGDRTGVTQKDDGDITINPFGDRKEPEEKEKKYLDVHRTIIITAENDLRGKYTVQEVAGKKHRIMIPKDAKNGGSKTWTGKGLIDASSGKAGDLILTFELDDSIEAVDEKFNLQKELTNYWKGLLHELWGVNKAPFWKTYFAPDIPAQALSNAIYNIAENEIRAKDVIAILDCSGTAEVACGEGIIMTADKIYINLAMDGWGYKSVPKAVIDLKTVGDIKVETKKKLLGQQQILHWAENTKNGQVAHSYNNVRSGIVNMDKLVNHIKFIKKHYM